MTGPDLEGVPCSSRPISGCCRPVPVRLICRPRRPTLSLKLSAFGGLHSIRQASVALAALDSLWRLEIPSNSSPPSYMMHEHLSRHSAQIMNQLVFTSTSTAQFTTRPWRLVCSPFLAPVLFTFVLFLRTSSTGMRGPQRHFCRFL